MLDGSREFSEFDGEHGAGGYTVRIPFSPEPFFNDSLVTRPFAPSLDRLDGTRGYQRDNVRLVCTIANFAMNRWGETVLFQLAQGIVAHQGFGPLVAPDSVDEALPA